MGAIEPRYAEKRAYSTSRSLKEEEDRERERENGMIAKGDKSLLTRKSTGYPEDE